MKKEAAAKIALLGMCMILTRIASADTIPFSDVIDWNTITKEGRDAVKVDKPGPFTFTHVLSFDPSADSFVGPITLTISHYGIKPPKEVWLAFGGNGMTLLDIMTGPDKTWVDQTFTIPTSLFPSFPASTWSLLITLEDDPAGEASDIWLDKSVLSGFYTSNGPSHMPEPATVTLLGIGFGGLCLVRIRARRKNGVLK